MEELKTTKSNFGKWGWSMIVYSGLLYYFAAGMTTDGLNIFPEAFGNFRGWNPGAIAAWASIGALTAIPGTILFSMVSLKIGSRITGALGLIMTGLCTLVFATATNWGVFLAGSVGIQFFAGSIMLSVVPNTLMNNWFPVKKGLALGWASMGMPVCTATFVALLAFLMHTTNPSTAYIIIAAVLVIFGVISLFWVKDNPEDAGCSPDNIEMTADQIAESKKMQHSYKSDLTIGRVLKDKRAWLVGLGLGLMWMVVVGIVSRLIVRLMSIGYTQPAALTMLTIVAVVGIIGSYLWGWFDQKIGTRKTSMIYGAWWIIALLLLMVESFQPATFAAVVIVGIGIGGIGNLVPSMIGTVYGRKDYLMANRFIMPIACIVRSCAFALMSFALAATGGYTGAYGIFIIASVLGIVLVALIGKSGDKPVEAEAEEKILTDATV